MSDGCPDCGSAVEPVHAMPGYVACSNEDCARYNAAWKPESESE